MQSYSEIKKVKAAVRERDGQRCTKCGIASDEYIRQEGRNLDVHRIFPGSKYIEEYCITVCRQCHYAYGKTSAKQREKSLAAAGLEPGNPNPKGVAFGLSRSELSLVERVAKKMGVSRSAFMRKAIIEEAKKVYKKRRLANA